MFATAWGDNGGEANLLTALYGMQLYAEYDYTGDTRPDVVDERFRACTGEDPAAFAYMGDFNTPPGVAAKSEDPVNAAKFLLYEDPLVPLFAADTAGMSFPGFMRILRVNMKTSPVTRRNLRRCTGFMSSLPFCWS